MKKQILFVCLGNICRSPAAEGIMKTMVAKTGFNDLIHCDSAGTSALHEGEPADGRMIAHALERGYSLTSRSRPFRAPEDFIRFDYILTMDAQNYRNVLNLDPSREYHEKVIPLVHFCRLHNTKEVPDPYYEGEEGFRLVLDILEDACGELLKKIKAELAES